MSETNRPNALHLAESGMLTDEFLQWPPYGLDRTQKRNLLGQQLRELTRWHLARCASYASLLEAYDLAKSKFQELESLPFFPVRLFKLLDLKSVPPEEVVTTLTSSGTTGQAVSRICLDRITAGYQTKALVKILQEFVGKQRLPMLIIDHPSVIRDRVSFSARGAGILGLMNFGREHVYALRDEDMTCDLPAIEGFLQKHQGQPVLIFGFTFMVWQYFVRFLEQQQIQLKFPPSILIHSGGWKKLHEQAVDNQTFKDRLRKCTGIDRIHNFYGMVEQVGAIHMECEQGHLHTPAFSDIIIRNPADWSVAEIGEVGVIQVLSALPVSYPGHSLLTEDLGICLGEDDCRCGRLGKYFSVVGRVPQAELRGCGDTHAAG